MINLIQIPYYLTETFMRLTFLSTLLLVPLVCTGCGGGSKPELNSSRSELEAFLEEHPEGLSEDVVLEGEG